MPFQVVELRLDAHGQVIDRRAIPYPYPRTNLPRLANEKVKSIRGTRHLLRVNPKGQRGGEPENERQAKIARPNNGKAANLGQSSPAAISTYVTGGGYRYPRLEGGL